MVSKRWGSGDNGRFMGNLRETFRSVNREVKKPMRL